MITFVLAMVLHPEVVRKAHEELDTVVGQDRLPHISDKPSLPYVNAVLKEVLRWYPPTPLGLSLRRSNELELPLIIFVLAPAHRLMVDDVYEGMFLPAGCLVSGNTW
jgi:Cytochrome P450